MATVVLDPRSIRKCRRRSPAVAAPPSPPPSPPAGPRSCAADPGPSAHLLWLPLLLRSLPGEQRLLRWRSHVRRRLLRWMPRRLQQHVRRRVLRCRGERLPTGVEHVWLPILQPILLSIEISPHSTTPYTARCTADRKVIALSAFWMTGKRTRHGRWQDGRHSQLQRAGAGAAPEATYGEVRECPRTKRRDLACTRVSTHTTPC